MAKLNKIANLIKSAKKNEVASDFLKGLEYTIIKEDLLNRGMPSKSFKPSGISGCMRALYFEVMGYEPDKTEGSVNLIGICESGTNRHEAIQDYVMLMKKHGINCEWLDVEEYLNSRHITDPKVIEKKGNETKLYSEKYNMRFMCDGIIRYENKLYILEIKTETGNKFNKHEEPFQEHKEQATCYAMTLKIDDIIFVYENRDNCQKKAYLTHVTPSMKEYVGKKISTVKRFVKDEIVPPKQTDKCTYCKYKNECGGHR